MPIYFFDTTYVFIILGVVISALASANVQSTFRKYSKKQNLRNMTAEQAAVTILRNACIYDVRVERIGGNLTDHYDPQNKVLRLSDTVYHSRSIAAIGVAAHECGHAIQDQVSYAPIRIRNAIVPVVNISSKLSWICILAGLLFSISGLLHLGVITFLAVIVFQLITLPVEFNASARALKILDDEQILVENELHGAKKVLTAAALTYVAATISAILQLLRLLLLARRNRRD